MTAVVKVLQGAVEGLQSHDFDGNVYYRFHGIPYAKPPVGELRFKEPEPPESWIGTRDATRDGSSCYHRNDFTKQYEGSEDCLYLNVFTRQLPEKKYDLRPVMVFIHGGAFTGGSNSSKIHGADFLLTENVVLVTINYRFGLLGFLRVKDQQVGIHGNMGFKDQVLALRWVKDNIQQFNGDPDNVTLFGESAGAASVHYHVLSPMSRDLFHKAIIQSGAALNSWADECDHNVVTISKIYDPNVSNDKEATRVLKNLSVEELYEVQLKFLEQIEPGTIRPLGLVIEPASKKTSFLNKRPIDIITSGEYNKVPLIFGYNDQEGIMFNVIRKLRGDTKKVIADYFVPHNVDLSKNQDVRKNIINQLHNQYLSGADEDNNISRIISDSWFVIGIIGSVKNHSLTSAYPVYLYKMSLDTKLNLGKAILRIPHIPGCIHADDLGYLFNTFATPPLTPGSKEETSLRRVLRLWTNFAKFGNPTPNDKEFEITWKPAMARQLNTLHIAEEMRIEVNPEGKRLELWRQIYHQSPLTIKYL